MEERVELNQKASDNTGEDMTTESSCKCGREIDLKWRDEWLANKGIKDQRKGIKDLNRGVGARRGVGGGSEEGWRVRGFQSYSSIKK